LALAALDDADLRWLLECDGRPVAQGRGRRTITRRCAG
jgi:hypothetical protein